MWGEGGSERREGKDGIRGGHAPLPRQETEKAVSMVLYEKRIK